MLDSITYGLVGISSRDFFQSTSREAGVIKWAQFLQCTPPKIDQGYLAHTPTGTGVGLAAPGGLRSGSATHF